MGKARSFPGQSSVFALAAFRTPVWVWPNACEDHTRTNMLCPNSTSRFSDPGKPITMVTYSPTSRRPCQSTASTPLVRPLVLRPVLLLLGLRLLLLHALGNAYGLVQQVLGDAQQPVIQAAAPHVRYEVPEE